MPPTKKPTKPSTDPRAELRVLADHLRDCALHANTIATQGDVARVTREIDRARRMLAEWESLRGGNDLDARMHFLQGVDFFATVARKAPALEFLADAPPSPRSNAYGAEALVAKMQLLAPLAARHMDVRLVEQAIARRALGRWDWKLIVRAWGRLDMGERTWTTEWRDWREAKHPDVDQLHPQRPVAGAAPSRHGVKTKS